MAIVLAGSFLKECEMEASEYARWLGESPLEALDQGKRRMESVPVLLERSLAEAGEEARAAMGVIGLLGMAPFEREWVQIGMEASEGQAIKAIGKLAKLSLVRRTNGSYAVSHALVHTYARQACGAKAGALERLGELFSRIAEEESEKGAEGLHRLDPIRPHILPVMEQLAKTGEWEAAERLGWAIEDYLDKQGYPSERLRVAQTGIDLARERKDRKSEGNWLTILGNAYLNLGQVEKAIQHYQQALEIAREIGDRRGEGIHLGNLGNAYLNLGQVEKAIQHYQQALEIDREIGDRRGEGADLGNLGLAYAALGQVEKAIQHYQQALEIAREIGDRRGEGNHLGNLGNAYRNLGQVEKAIQHYQQALEIAREIGDRRNEGAWLGNLGVAYKKLGDMQKACELWSQAFKIFEEIKSPYAEMVRGLLEECEK